MSEANQYFQGDYAKIPAHMQDSLLEYVHNGRLTGDFLRAVMCNDLSGAVGHADDENLPLIPIYVRWLYNVAPNGCHGSVEQARKWKGLKHETVLS